MDDKLGFQQNVQKQLADQIVTVNDTGNTIEELKKNQEDQINELLSNQRQIQEAIQNIKEEIAKNAKA
jgi:hypothetical protein